MLNVKVLTIPVLKKCSRVVAHWLLMCNIFKTTGFKLEMTNMQANNESERPKVAHAIGTLSHQTLNVSG